jgi:hypothetical protein
MGGLCVAVARRGAAPFPSRPLLGARVGGGEARGKGRKAWLALEWKSREEKREGGEGGWSVAGFYNRALRAK